MLHACKLHSKCQKANKSLEKCEVVECKNVIHPSCYKNLMAMFGNNEWEGPLLCGNCCFKHHKKSVDAAASQTKGRVLWHNNGPLKKSA